MKGKYREYKDNNILLFEGDFLYNHRRWGKEYNKDGKIIFEGEYLYDKKWKRKINNKDDNIIYELKNGIGEIKEFNYKNIKIFEGEYLNFAKNRKGKEYYSNGKLEFEG